MDADAEERPGARAPAEIELLVPEDGERLLAELRRHGITPGQRVRVRTPATPPTTDRARFVSPAGALKGRLPDLTWIDSATAQQGGDR